MKAIKASAWGKLLLFGDHAVVYNRPCLAAAINRQITATLVNEKNRETVFVAKTRQMFEKKYGVVAAGFKINGFGSHYGLGSSAAVTVAVAKALFKFKKIKIAKKELFDFCYRVVKAVQGVGSGFDVAAAIYGGIVYFISGGKKIEKLAVKELPLVVGYSGVKANTVAMVKQAAAKIDETFLQQSEAIVDQARTALEAKNWREAGILMNQNQEILKDLGVSTPQLDKMISVAREAGAYGAKLSGAGGGDCMIALVSDEKKLAVESAIARAGGEIINLKLAR
jgi:mevalonate kinase